jgi:trehalose 6-phosphate phosphatase
MKYLFSEQGKKKLDRFCSRPFCLVFDFDGTLAPFYKIPDQVKMRPKTKNLLKKLSGLVPLAVVTGRSRKNALTFLTGISFQYVVGNHGAEGASRPSAIEKKRAFQARALVKEWVSRLTPPLSQFPFIEIENKGLTLSIHFGKSPRNIYDNPKFNTQMRLALKKVKGYKQILGRDVINLIPPFLPHKGDAVCEVKKNLGVTRAIFLGDDVTDEDCFKLKNKDLLGIRIGSSKKTKASFYLKDQKEIDRFLAYILLLKNT